MLLGRIAVSRFMVESHRGGDSGWRPTEGGAADGAYPLAEVDGFRFFHFGDQLMIAVWRFQLWDTIFFWIYCSAD
jgi:hypothetical protein